MHNPKNPQYVAVRDTESANGAVDSVTVKLRANEVSFSVEELRGAFISRFTRLASCVAAGVYKANYEEAPMIETTLRAAVVFTLRDIKVAGPPRRTREQRLAALCDGSRRRDNDSRRGKRSGGHSLNGQFCLAHAATAASIKSRDCGPNGERCTSHSYY